MQTSSVQHASSHETIHLGSFAPNEMIETVNQGLLRLKTGLSYIVTATGVSARTATITVCSLTNLAVLAHFRPVAKVLEYLAHSSLEIMQFTAFTCLPLGAFKAGQLLDAALPAAPRQALLAGKGALYLLAALLIGESLYSKFSSIEGLPSPSWFPESFSILSTLILLNLGAQHVVNWMYKTEEKAQEVVKKIN